MYSEVPNTSDGAGHARRDDLNSSREAADTKLRHKENYPIILQVQYVPGVGGSTFSSGGESKC